MVTETRTSRTAQLTDKLLMVFPDQFGFNHETAGTNSFQNKPDQHHLEVRSQAILEFNGMVNKLRENGISVYVAPSPTGQVTPDAVFPNNWISFHRELSLKGIDTILYPMMANNRRAERQPNTVYPLIKDEPKSRDLRLLDLSYLEDQGLYLEGTGSLIFDRFRKVVFAHESPRTNLEALNVFCSFTDYEPVVFHANDKTGQSIYHTNVVMSIGSGFSVVCLEAIPDDHEKLRVEKELDRLHLEIIEITQDQVSQFCGNVLEVQPHQGDPLLVMSQTAYDGFDLKQKDRLAHYANLLPVNIPTIESVGGGSARCMMAEIFVNK
ncbi:MAG: arginine deiminase-related protein [Candidatus Daviesbacteria bacterium]|nr:arginine deiminase-related protein [Candidatus Daviesbacteria bacterium]